MRFAVFHNQPSGGARRALAGFCEHLRRSDDVDVYALTTADDEWIPDARLGRAVPRIEYSRRRPIRFGLWLNDVRRARDLHDLDAANRAAASAIDAGGHDAVLVDVCQFSLVPSLLRYVRTPAAYYAHNGPAALEGGAWRPSQSSYEQLRDWWHGPVARRLARQQVEGQRSAIAAASLVLANSSHTASRVRAAWGRDALVCPPGVELPARAPDVEGAGLLSVGEIEPRKGFDFVVDSVARIDAERRPPLRICANRSNPLTRRRLEEQARQLGVRLRIDLNPPQEELWQAYESAAVFVYGARHEALGLAPLEAMARGRPVVAVDEGGLGETVRHGLTGLLTRRDPDEFAASIVSLLADADRRRALGRAGRSHVQRSWTWSVRAPALRSALEALARSCHGAVR